MATRHRRSRREGIRNFQWFLNARISGISSQRLKLVRVLAAVLCCGGARFLPLEQGLRGRAGEGLVTLGAMTACRGQSGVAAECEARSEAAPAVLLLVWGSAEHRGGSLLSREVTAATARGGRGGRRGYRSPGEASPWKWELLAGWALG